MQVVMGHITGWGTCGTCPGHPLHGQQQYSRWWCTFTPPYTMVVPSTVYHMTSTLHNMTNTPTKQKPH
jgi:hypothetical protein